MPTIRVRPPQFKFFMTCVIAIVLAGCTGTIGSTDRPLSPPAAVPPLESINASGHAPPDPRAVIGEAKGNITPEPIAATPAPETTVASTPLVTAPTPVRGLTSFEYDNTIRDLLGDDSHPAAAFPPEELGNGFGNDAAAQTVSQVLVEQHFEAAQDIADRLTSDSVRLSNLLGCDAKTNEVRCINTFIETFGMRALRRPLTPGQTDLLSRVYSLARNGADVSTGVNVVLQVLLQSPQFLYRIEQSTFLAGNPRALDPYELASRLSYLLWNSMPDAALFSAAAAGQLQTPTQIRAQAVRMLADPRAQAMVRYFHGVLFGISAIETIYKDPIINPLFDRDLGLLPRLHAEADRFLDHVIWDGKGDLGTIFTAPYSFIDKMLAKHYQLSGTFDDEFKRVEFDPKKRSGILTFSGVLTALTPGREQTNPTRRGSYIRGRLLCSPPPDPPSGLNIVAPEPDAKQTTRQLFEAHARNPACAGCHQLMDPFGFGLESYDAVGLWRTKDNGQPINTRATIVGTDIAGAFDGPASLMKKLAGSADLQRCYAGHWFTFAYGRAPHPSDMGSRRRLDDAFAKAAFDIKSLVLELTQTDAFLYHNEEISP